MQYFPYLQHLRRLFTFFLLATLVLPFGSCKKFKNGVLEIYELRGVDNIYYAILQEDDGTYEAEKEITTYLPPYHSGQGSTFKAYYWPDESPSSLGYKYKCTSTSDIKFKAEDECRSSVPGSKGHWASNSSSGGSSTGGTSTSGTQTLLSQLVSGKNQDKLYVRFTLPSGVKSMKVTSTSAGPYPQYQLNLNDMFVRKGSDPTCSLTPRYTWVADCAGVEPNNVDEVCNFTNPAAGQWSVMLYGYNSSFDTKLVVTIVK